MANLWQYFLVYNGKNVQNGTKCNVVRGIILWRYKILTSFFLKLLFMIVWYCVPFHLFIAMLIMTSCNVVFESTNKETKPKPKHSKTNNKTSHLHLLFMILERKKIHLYYMNTYVPIAACRQRTHMSLSWPKG